MSRQLTFSAVLCTLAVAAAALTTSVDTPSSGGARGATAHGSIFSVLLRA